MAHALSFRAGRSSRRDDVVDGVMLPESERITPEQADANARLMSASPDLLKALKAENDLVCEAQNLLAMYLEPGDRRIQSPEDLVNSLLTHFDGPRQRRVQGNAQAAITKACSEHTSNNDGDFPVSDAEGGEA